MTNRFLWEWQTAQSLIDFFKNITEYRDQILENENRSAIAYSEKHKSINISDLFLMLNQMKVKILYYYKFFN